MRSRAQARSPRTTTSRASQASTHLRNAGVAASADLGIIFRPCCPQRQGAQRRIRVISSFTVTGSQDSPAVVRERHVSVFPFNSKGRRPRARAELFVAPRKKKKTGSAGRAVSVRYAQEVSLERLPVVRSGEDGGRGKHKFEVNRKPIQLLGSRAINSL